MEPYGVVSRVRRLRRPSRHFLYTIPQTSLTREDVLAIIRPVVGDAYAIGMESHADGGSHIHCYFKTRDAYLLDDLKKDMAGYVDGDLQVCRSARNAAVYCLKEDKSPLRFGLDQSVLSFPELLLDWCRAHPKFILDDFTSQHSHRLRYIREYHDQYWLSERRRTEDDTAVRVDNAIPWVRDVGRRLCGRQHVFLVGPSGVGKSTVVSRFCRKLAGPERQDDIYRVIGGDGRFEFDGVNDTTLYLILDDVDLSYLTRWRYVLHAFMDHREIRLDSKYNKSYSVKFSGQVIVISNYGLPTDDEAWSRRIQTVQAPVQAVFPVDLPPTTDDLPEPPLI